MEKIIVRLGNALHILELKLSVQLLQQLKMGQLLRFAGK